MPAAKRQTDLIAVTRKEFAKLEALLDGVRDDEAGVKDADGTSIKDVIAHRAHWAGPVLRWYEDGPAGKAVELPARGCK